MTETVYKVLAQIPVEGGDLFSCWARGKSRVIYRPGEWAYPPEWLWSERQAGLLAFTDLQRARAWARTSKDPRSFQKDYHPPIRPWTQIWKAEAVKCQEHRSFDSGLLDKGSASATWASPGWPMGTVFCSRIKLIEEIEI